VVLLALALGAGGGLASRYWVLGLVALRRPVLTRRPRTLTRRDITTLNEHRDDPQYALVTRYILLPSSGPRRLGSAARRLSVRANGWSALCATRAVSSISRLQRRLPRHYVDAKRAILRPAGFAGARDLVAERSAGSLATPAAACMGAVRSPAPRFAAGEDVKAFFVRKEDQHPAHAPDRGPPLESGDRCRVVPPEDVVTTAGRPCRAIEALQDAGREILRRVCVLDLLVLSAARRSPSPQSALRPRCTTSDDVYPYAPTLGLTSSGVPRVHDRT